jgi:hypothetical protein
MSALPKVQAVIKTTEFYLVRRLVFEELTSSIIRKVSETGQPGQHPRTARPRIPCFRESFRGLIVEFTASRVCGRICVWRWALWIEIRALDNELGEIATIVSLRLSELRSRWRLNEVTWLRTVFAFTTRADATKTVLAAAISANCDLDHF